MANDIDLSGVAPSDVSAVLARAISLIEEHGWTPKRGPTHLVDGKRRPTGRISVLQAITFACDEVGLGVETAELHTACLDAVCLSVSGKRHGQGASVSRWERDLAAAATDKAIQAERQAIIAALCQASDEPEPVE